MRAGPGASGAAVTIDTRGRPQKVELFLEKGKWAAIAPDIGREGTLTLPARAKGEPLQPNTFGLRVPPGDYTVDASYAGRSVQRKVRVPRESTTVNLRWPEEVKP